MAPVEQKQEFSFTKPHFKPPRLLISDNDTNVWVDLVAEPLNLFSLLVLTLALTLTSVLSSVVLLSQGVHCLRAEGHLGRDHCGNRMEK